MEVGAFRTGVRLSCVCDVGRTLWRLVAFRAVWGSFPRPSPLEHGGQACSSCSPN